MKISIRITNFRLDPDSINRRLDRFSRVRPYKDINEESFPVNGRKADALKKEQRIGAGFGAA